MRSEPSPLQRQEPEGICHQIGFDWRIILFLLSLSALLFDSSPALADQVEMRNGDRYVGQVLSLDTNQLVLQSEVIGTIRLPRGQVVTIQLGNRAAKPAAARPAVTNAVGAPPLSASPEISAALRQLGAKTNFVQQVQKQFLSDAGPEANQQFNELVNGLLSGKLTVSDLRVQAKTVSDQLRSAQKELGEENSWAMDSYLAILDHFLKETAPPTPSTTTSTTNAPANH